MFWGNVRSRWPRWILEVTPIQTSGNTFCKHAFPAWIKGKGYW